MSFIEKIIEKIIIHKMKNKILALTQTKFMHGLFIAVGGAISTAVYNAINSGHLPQSWADVKPIVILGASAAAVYILKNLGFGSGAPTVPTSTL